MINGYERASKLIVPAARVVIARELKIRYNMTEARIAQILGIAQAAVSKYLNEDYSENVKSATEKVDMGSVNRYIEKIASGNENELKKCVCTVCASMNKFDCKFSGAEVSAKAEK